MCSQPEREKGETEAVDKGSIIVAIATTSTFGIVSKKKTCCSVLNSSGCFRFGDTNTTYVWPFLTAFAYLGTLLGSKNYKSWHVLSLAQGRNWKKKEEENSKRLK